MRSARLSWSLESEKIGHSHSRPRAVADCGDRRWHQGTSKHRIIRMDAHTSTFSLPPARFWRSTALHGSVYGGSTSPSPVMIVPCRAIMSADQLLPPSPSRSNMFPVGSLRGGPDRWAALPFLTGNPKLYTRSIGVHYSGVPGVDSMKVDSTEARESLPWVSHSLPGRGPMRAGCAGRVFAGARVPGRTRAGRHPPPR